MNRKKPSSETPWMRHELRALRSEEPNPAAIEGTVGRVLAFSPASDRTSVRPNHAWKAVPLAACLGVAGMLLFVAPQRASAAGLREIADALRGQTTRHAKTYRPDAGGNLTLANEDWIDGKRHVTAFNEPGGEKTLIGYDGRRMFRVSTVDGGFVDDVEPSGLPIEDIDAYLRIPGARLVKQTSEGRWDVYRVDCPAVRFDLYVDPATRLPARRDVLSFKGRLIERNEYEYPATLAADRFRVPAMPGIADYPALRRELAARLNLPGQTKEIGGVRISLKAVLVGKSRILALWTGGAKGDWVSDGDLRIEGLPKPPIQGRPDAFTVPLGATKAPPLFRGQPVLGDGAWYPNLRLQGPFTLSVPVWAEDRTRPIPGGKGHRSKLVGRLSFRVTDPILAPDPDRVVWAPSGEAVAVTGGEAQEAKP